ncbi:DNA-(Apurinic or apyrimidinic site) lyase 2 [Pleurostoma richardsiae]|uniref:DNA-(apurinic or apyrimidinic site) endonuclease 2 n=1 Tax=Pleurostoma richardsiae TaxID=41990 RepID=A0AA38S3N6_9PEZI|nr:DNA-(Apurinic or apyrimidinic site) lyase 2 [Pleurostoma richardsiae]
MGLRITSWNVNGIRNPFGYEPWRQQRTFHAMFDTLEADIVIMQETKIQRKDLRDDMVLVPGWDVYFSLPKHKKGYSGVAIYTRNAKCCPIRAEEGITGVLCPPSSSTMFRDLPEGQRIGGYPRPGQLSGIMDEAALDSEGRCVILEFPAFVLIGVYCPATRDETRTEFRLGFIEALDARVRNLIAMGKEVVLTGDLNIIRSEQDTAGLMEQLRKENMTLDDFLSTPARKFLNQLLFGGRVVGERDEGREKPVMWDLCRLFHPNRQGMYTCWETKKNARPGNFGSRIDYVLCSAGIKDWFCDANIQEGLMGSDHCPVYATLADVVKLNGRDVHIVDIMNPKGMFQDGKRLRDWTVKDLLPLSAKLIPEFDRRRSIRDMFFTKGSSSKTPPASTNSPGTNDIIPEVLESQQASTSLTPDDSATESASIDEIPPALSQTSSITATSSSTTPKRAASMSSVRPQKKQKPSLAKEASKSGDGLSQKSLMGFFKPKSSTGAAEEQTGKVTESTPSPSKMAPPAAPAATSSPQRINSKGGVSENGLGGISRSADGAGDGDTDKVFDPIESKESWSKLLGKRVVPKCEHNEPCISLVTKKPGINCGRSFYICPRPLGPSGDKEKGTQWRCGTFIWSSDWNGSQQGR